MRQVRAFDPSKGGTRPYYCLANVRLGYGIGPVYADAWTAWQNTQQHTNRSIPTGVDVPLFYSFTATIDGVRKNWGHINVRYRDGRVWNDGRWFANLAAFEAAHRNVKYVGWGESVNNVRVIERSDVKFLLSQHGQNVLNRFYLGRNTPDGIKHRVGNTEFHVESERYRDTAIFARKIEQARAGTLDVKEHLPSELRRVYKDPSVELKKENDTLKAQNEKLAATVKLQAGEIDKLDSEVNVLSKKVKDLEAQLALQSEDSIQLNALGKSLKWFIERLGLK